MTEQQFQTLARYEDNLRQASGGRWARHPGRTALSDIYKVVTEVAGPQPRLQYFCQPCVLRLLKKAADLYFAEKTAKAVATAKKEAEAKPKKPRTKKVVS